MRPIKILVDSCADMDRETLEKWDVDYAKMNTVKDGVQTPASLLWEYYTPKELYDTIRGGVRVTTTQVPPEEFVRVFRQYLDAGYDIVYIACSVKQSGSVNTGNVVANELLPEYPGARIACINSMNSSAGIGLLAIRASQMVKDGIAFDEIVETVNGLRNRVNQYCTVNTLDYLKRAGRVKGSKAFFGNLFGIKPIIISDADGEQTPVKKAKGRLGSFEEIVNMLAETIENPEEQTIYLSHADCAPEEVETLKKMITDKIPCRGVHVGYIGPIIGASVGPDAVAIFAFGKEVTYRVGAEQ